MIKKTLSISAFKDEPSVWTMKVSTHMYVKNIQRRAIKAEREKAKKDPHHLVLQIENWPVFFVNEQIYIFTAVSYQGDSTQTFTVISDD